MFLKVGIDLGGSHIAIGVIDFNSREIIIEKTERRLLKEEKSNIKVFIEKYIEDILKGLEEKYDITDIGIAIPGTISQNKIKKIVNLGIENYDIVNNLHSKIATPIKIINDAKAAALAEYNFGCLKNYKRSIFLTLGTGIGGAVLIDGKLLDTGSFPGCEFGHIVIDKNGEQCNCGNKGCFEKYGSMKTLKNNLRRELGLDETTRGQVLLDIIRENENNPIIKKVIDEYIDNLSIGIANLINIFEPEAIGIGGSFIYFADVLLNKIKENLGKYIFNKRDETVVLPAVLGNDAGIIGSVI